ncbi:MAG: putative transport system permease protein, partial [Mycobacterium sp.]|nr:putative transport system permease protein [Mycobacterium sp.]
QITKSFVGDLVETSGGGGGGGGGRGALGPEVSHQLAGLTGIAAAAPIRAVEVAIDGKSTDILATDPAALAKVVHIDVTAGTLDHLGIDQIAVSKDKADTAGLRVGSTVKVAYADTGAHDLTVAAIYDKVEPIDSPYLVSTAFDDANRAQPRDLFVFVKLQPDADLPAARAAVKQTIAPYPTAKIEDLAGLKRTLTSRINTLIAVLFGMLALSILIASIGISNTLQLSVHERTQELGLLRAVGTTREQLRTMVRWESAIIAVFGTVGGLVLGTAFGWAVIHGLGSANDVLFRVPVGQALLIVIAGALIGVLAAVRPARRAAKLDVLQAIASE